ncbi:MAG TPA: outer membrane beta-barrel protein [Ferruginibacter sp.]|nr:outer membrane beta-barrel protein [Ferruginibacter sp.]
MENNFYRDEFEQMLRDTTEDFRMYPSRKVWHSIYNDLHPDRKWPSFAVCLLLLTGILYIGVSNNNSISKKSRALMASSISSISDSKTLLNSDENADNTLTAIKKNNAPITFINNSNIEKENILIQGNSNFSNDLKENNTATTAIYNKEEIDNKSTVSKMDIVTVNTNNEVNSTGNYTDNSLLTKSNNKNDLNNDNGVVSNFKFNDKNSNAHIAINTTPNSNNEIANSNSFVNPVELHNSKIKDAVTHKLTILSTEEKSWLEDHAFHNKRNRNKWKTNLSFQYYITPSIGYRQLSKNYDAEPAGNGLLLRTIDNDVVTQQAAPNFEAGTQVLFDLSKKLKFKTGLQFNYTNYITYAHGLQHPTQTTVLMNDLNNNNLMQISYNSVYGNVLGSNFSRLNNKTTQVSIPLGFDYKLAGNNKIQWFVGSGIQPSYILSGKAFLISADKKNFVEDASVLRKWNLNTSFETFVSIKTPSGININVGPQFRYQLLSTYSKKYSYTEKLYNAGIKIGVTKKL